MNIITVSATKARNDFFKLLEEVKKGKEVIIKKDREIVATMIKIKDLKKKNNKGLVKALEEASAVLKFDKNYVSPLRKSVPEFFGHKK